MTANHSLGMAFQQALKAHQSGDLQQAAAGYNAILAQDADHIDALHALGVLLLQVSKPDSAVPLLEKALRLKPAFPLAWQNLASAFRSLNNPARAADCLLKKIALEPADHDTLRMLADLSLAAHRNETAETLYLQLLTHSRSDPSLHINLGLAQRALTQHEKALQSFSTAKLLDPRNIRAAINIGISLTDLKRFDAALSEFERLQNESPNYAPAHNARALTLWQMGRLADAETAYGEAIAHDPTYSEPWSNRAALFVKQNRDTEALRDYQQAINLQSSNAEAHNGFGILQARHKHLKAAVASFRQAIAIRPSLAAAHNNLGLALMEAGQVAEAKESYDTAVELKWSDPVSAAKALANRSDWWSSKGRYLEAATDARAALRIDPKNEYTLGKALYCELRECNWGRFLTSVNEIKLQIFRAAAVATPFVGLVVTDDPQLQLQCARTYASSNFQSSTLPIQRQPLHERIKLAWLSADFHEHATAHLIAGVLEKFDRNKFELIALSYGPATGDRYQLRLRGAFDQFIDVRERSDAEVASLAQSLAVDIAVDLKGYTNLGRPGILCQRAAPVQVSYLGYPGTLALGEVDYLIADQVTVPKGHEAFYSEKIVRLPCCYQANDDRRPVSTQRFSRTELGLPEAGFVFCNFNSSYKITPDVFDIWMRLLINVPGSILWLLEENILATSNLRREAAARHVNPDRLVFAAKLASDEHLARHQCADLFLDTWPVNAHTTASDALWAGLPIVTLTGNSFASRVASSLMHSAGLDEWITDSSEKYEAMALALANQPAELNRFRTRVHAARNTSQVFDTQLTTRCLEAAFEQMHQRQIRALPPAHFDVALP